MSFEVTGFYNVLFPSLLIARVVHVYRQCIKLKLKDSLWYLMWLPFIPHFLNRLLTEASQSQIETCSKVLSIKPALKATELTKVMASCTWSSGASELITDNFFRVNYLKTSYHLFCSVLTVFLSMFIDNDFKLPKVNHDESIACKELISSEKMFASNI